MKQPRALRIKKAPEQAPSPAKKASEPEAKPAEAKAKPAKEAAPAAAAAHIRCDLVPVTIPYRTALQG